MSRITSKDVARAAGVSQTTVSFALNGVSDQRVPPETRERIVAVAKQLGYVPSNAARALKKGHSDTVLFVIPRAIGPNFPPVLNDLTHLLAPDGLSVVVAAVNPSRPFRDLWVGLSPLAVVSTVGLSPEDSAELLASGVTPISIGSTVAQDSRGYVAPSRASDLESLGKLNGALQARYLLERGHRRLGYAMPAQREHHELAEHRLNGVRQICREHDAPEPLALTVSLDVPSATDAVRHWKSEAAEVTAVCAFNDEYALAVLAGMRALALAAPKDLAVMGVDDVTVAPLADPPLTTINLGSSANLAADAASVLRDVMTTKIVKRHDLVLTHRVVVRESA